MRRTFLLNAWFFRHNILAALKRKVFVGMGGVKSEEIAQICSVDIRHDIPPIVEDLRIGRDNNERQELTSERAGCIGFLSEFFRELGSCRILPGQLIVHEEGENTVRVVSGGVFLVVQRRSLMRSVLKRELNKSCAANIV